MYKINWLQWNLQDYKDFFASIDRQRHLPVVFNTVAKHCIRNGTDLIDLNVLEVSNINLDCRLNEIVDEKTLRNNKSDRLQRMINDLDRQNKQIYIPAPLGVKINENYLLIDGNHRFAIAKALKLPIKLQLINNSILGKCFLNRTQTDSYLNVLLVAYRNILDVSRLSS